MEKTRVIKKHFIIIAILFVALVLRIYHLGFQSLWLDELYTVNDADPSTTWSETIKQVAINQQQSPLYYFIQKLLFTLFGFNDFIARIISVIAGTAGVWVIYLLGKELYGTKIGHIAALLTCVNYYHIYYSQEARAYTLFFLMAIIAFLFLLRAFNTYKWKYIIGFGLSGALMVHFHFYGIFVVIAQFLFSMILYILNKQPRAFILKKLSLGFIIIIVFTIPLINTMLMSMTVDATWVPYVQPDFLISYFYEYFGNTDLLKPILVLLLLCFIIPFLFEKENQKETTINVKSSALGMLLLLVWFISVNIIPYLLSLLGKPILVTRYTIATLPVYLFVLSLGISSFKQTKLQGFVLIVFVGLSFIDLVYVKQYYSRPQKTQFRQLALLIKNTHKSQIPILNEEHLWVEKYYNNKFELGNPIITGAKQNLLDSIIHRANNHQLVSGFWIVGAHNEKKPSEELLNVLDTLFVKSKSEEFLDAWAMLYLPQGSNSGNKKINFNSFNSNCYFALDNETVIALWNKEMVSSYPIDLPNGNFSLTVTAKGSPCENEFPQLGIYINDKLIGKYFMKEYFMESPVFHFDNPTEGRIKIGLINENDKTNVLTHEDRNAFIQSIKITRD